MLTIAHISDLHLSADHHRKRIRKTRRLLEYVAAADVDHLVITGDIAANAEKRDLQLARGILKSSGWLDSRSLSVVIGNHDVFGGVNHAEDILTFPRHCRETDYKGKVAEFYDYFHEAFDTCLHDSRSHVFPYAKVIGDVAFVGLNSVAEFSRVRNPIGSNGEVQKHEFRTAGKIMSSDLLAQKNRIVLIHHHFYKRPGEDGGTIHSIWNAIEGQTMKLRGKKKLLSLFGRFGVGMVLHGHVHENREYSRSGVRLLNGGGSVMESGGLDVKLNMIKVSGDSIRTRQIFLAEGPNRVHRVVEAETVEHVAA